MIRIKRIYDPPEATDGRRLLVDRLWPRGLAKEKAQVDDWLKELAPSSELRTWFGHDPAKWEEFRRRYEEELQGQREQLAKLHAESEKRTVTLLYAAKDEEHNNAAVLKELVGNA
ncbi:protein of unknown function DUF488 [Geotalea daltonii FRC-32]|uniref:DUF488 domain-containing protein n=1 Tax=Geotalea daltonii (strain DSM 22248 / JCM 15807 / FRC-32) TaxID=316067 RepID=B9M3Y2_GEODF|nr:MULTISPECIES: DUF488 family protein [Geotalea]ACM19625.1 protein of unknown function DUF488 [Geotalea daltonii FRC-32]